MPLRDIPFMINYLFWFPFQNRFAPPFTLLCLFWYRGDKNKSESITKQFAEEFKDPKTASQKYTVSSSVKRSRVVKDKACHASRANYTSVQGVTVENKTSYKWHWYVSQSQRKLKENFENIYLNSGEGSCDITAGGTRRMPLIGNRLGSTKRLLLLLPFCGIPNIFCKHKEWHYKNFQCAMINRKKNRWGEWVLRTFFGPLALSLISDVLKGKQHMQPRKNSRLRVHICATYAAQQRRCVCVDLRFTYITSAHTAATLLQCPFFSTKFWWSLHILLSIHYTPRLRIFCCFSSFLYLL